MVKNYFTSESVTCGHPDKVCDQIADRILDGLLEQDPRSRVACEVTCATNAVHVFGEVTTTAELDYAAAARRVIREIGYTTPGQGFDAETCRIQVDLHAQSPDIARGIDRRTQSELLNSGAGDQGMMFGYACTETPSLMPLPIELAHSLAKRLEQVRRINELNYLLPDGKTQVTVEYNEKDQPKRIAAVIVSSQHRDTVETKKLRSDIL
ncbi:MAG: S-adenosylmethionine synthetase N-terminal domain-containing protein, partial [Faecousia sp.]